MKNPFILVQLSHGILQKKPHVDSAIIRQSFIFPIKANEKYRIKANGHATFCLEEAEGIEWNDGSTSTCKEINNQEFYFKCLIPPEGIKIILTKNDQELNSISIKETMEMPDGELLILNQELVRNHDFTKSTEEYFFDSDVPQNSKKIRWIQGYNKYIVREAK
jgi:hypothetical protein